MFEIDSMSRASIKKILGELLSNGRSEALKGDGCISEWENEFNVKFTNPQATRMFDTDELSGSDLHDWIENEYNTGEVEDEQINFTVEAKRIMREGQTTPELDVKLDVDKTFTDYDSEYDGDEFDVDEYESSDGEMTRVEKVKAFGLEEVDSHEVGTFSGSGDSGDFEPTGGTLGNTDFQSWIYGKVDSLMRSCNPNFNNEGAYGSVKMSAHDGVITLDLMCNSGFSNEEHLLSMEEII